MSKGSYRGGSTIIRPGSDWFSFSEEPEPLPVVPAKRCDPFKEAFRLELEALQAKDDPNKQSSARERQIRQKELKRLKKAAKADAFRDLAQLNPEEQRALAEARKWSKVEKKFKALHSKVFKTPTV